METNNRERALNKQVLSGLVWTFGERIAAQGVSFVVSIVLARILLPEEYGVIALIAVLIEIANVFVSNGFGECLVQKKDSDENDFSTIFYCSLFFSFALYFTIFAAAKWISLYYSKPALEALLKVFALKLPISSISTIQHAYVSKHMMFKKFFFSTLGGTVVSGVVGIGMALSGFGAWALIAQYLTNTVIDTVVLFFIVPWRPKLIFSWKSFRELFGYAWRITVASLINTLYVQLRSIVIGTKYTTEDLAYYSKAQQFPSLIVVNIDSSIGKVIFPTMTKFADDKERLREVSRRALKMSSYIVFPLIVGLLFVAEPLVKLLLTDKWLFCVPYLRIACMFYIFAPLQTTNWQIIKAVGRGDLCLKLETIKKCIGIVLLIFSMNYGVMAIAVSSAVFAGASAIINMIPNKKIIGYSLIQQLADLAPIVFLNMLMGGCVYCVGLLHVPTIAILILQIVSGGFIYLGGSIIFKIDSFVYLFDMIKKYTHNK